MRAKKKLLSSMLHMHLAAKFDVFVDKNHDKLPTSYP